MASHGRSCFSLDPFPLRHPIFIILKWGSSMRKTSEPTQDYYWQQNSKLTREPNTERSEHCVGLPAQNDCCEGDNVLKETLVYERCKKAVAKDAKGSLRQ